MDIGYYVQSDGQGNCFYGSRRAALDSSYPSWRETQEYQRRWAVKDLVERVVRVRLLSMRMNHYRSATEPSVVTTRIDSTHPLTGSRLGGVLVIAAFIQVLAQQRETEAAYNSRLIKVPHSVTVPLESFRMHTDVSITTVLFVLIVAQQLPLLLVKELHIAINLVLKISDTIGITFIGFEISPQFHHGSRTFQSCRRHCFTIHQLLGVFGLFWFTLQTAIRV
jgi:hypothetical protein